MEGAAPAPAPAALHPPVLLPPKQFDILFSLFSFFSLFFLFFLSSSFFFFSLLPLLLFSLLFLMVKKIINSVSFHPFFKNIKGKNNLRRENQKILNEIYCFVFPIQLQFHYIPFSICIYLYLFIVLVICNEPTISAFLLSEFLADTAVVPPFR